MPGQTTERSFETYFEKILLTCGRLKLGKKAANLAVFVPLVRATEQIANAPDKAGDLGVSFSGHESGRCPVVADVVVRFVLDDDFNVILFFQWLHGLVAGKQHTVLRTDARRDVWRVINDVFRNLKWGVDL